MPAWLALGAGVQAYAGVSAVGPTGLRPPAGQPALAYAVAVGGATLAYYAAHRLYARRAPARPHPRDRYVRPRLLRTAALAGLGLSAVGLWSLPRAYFLPLAVASVGAVAYTLPLARGRRLRDIGWLKALWLADAWTAVCYGVPQAAGGTWDWLTLASRFASFLALALLFDARDAPFDRAAGVVTLAGKLGTRVTGWLAAGLFGLSATVDALHPTLATTSSWWLPLIISSVVGAALAIGTSLRPRRSLLYYEVGLDGLVVLPWPIWAALWLR